MRKIVVYLRVSTKGQFDSELGIRAQQETVKRFLSNNDVILAEFVEVESGTMDERPKLAAALALAKAEGATLVVAKLDRLARSVKTICRIMESGVDFVAADFPTANTLTLHIIAAIAEYEAKLIGERTKAALSQAKAMGKTLGWQAHKSGKHNNPWGNMPAERKKELSLEHFAVTYKPVLPIVRALRAIPVKEIAAELNRQGYKTPKGAEWGSTQVSRVLQKLKELD